MMARATEPPSPRLQATDDLPHPLLVICSGALVAGGGEYILRTTARALSDRPVLLDPASAWMGPVSALALLGVAAAIVWFILLRVLSAGAARRGVIVTTAALVTFDLLLFVPRLHDFARVALASGMASVGLGLALRFSRPSIMILRASVVALLVVCVAATAAPLRRDLTEGARGSGGANVILLVLDTVRALELSAYGFGRPTSPALDHLASEGIAFERAVAPAPWTLATHATLFTGLYQYQLDVGWATPLGSEPRTLAETFLGRGYTTGGFVANLRYCTREYGLARGFQSYRDYSTSLSQFIGSTMLGRRAIRYWNMAFDDYVLPGRKSADTVIDEFLDWQQQVGPRPFFAFINVFDAHEPYDPPQPFDSMLVRGDPPTRSIEPDRQYLPQHVAQLRDAYDGAIAAQDAALGRLFDTLRERGLLDRSIIVVTSDHGEEFAEHGHLGHGNGLHFPSLHVPLIIRYPSRIPSEKRESTPVSLRDVPQTILDLADVVDERIGGTSLMPLIAGTPDGELSPILSELYWVPNQPNRYPVSAGNMRSIVHDGLHLIERTGGPDELYDITTDPWETTDLAEDVGMAQAKANLKRLLSAFPMEDRGGR
ncbi:MAG: sulfatase [Gemmatimonadota bacterium]